MDKKQNASFAGFVLLGQSEWDKDKFISCLKNEWGEEISAAGEDGVFLRGKIRGNGVAIGFVNAPVPDGDMEYYALMNYMWGGAAEAVKDHKAHIMINVTGADAVDCSLIYVKLCCAALRQEGALALYQEGAVFEPEFYLDAAELLSDGDFPIINLVWFGLYSDGENAGFYTSGLSRFGVDELEVYASPEGADYEAIRDFTLTASMYVLNGAVLRDGETIGLSDEQQFAVSVGKGIAVLGKSVKIAYK